jgi:hypothetical protein
MNYFICPFLHQPCLFFCSHCGLEDVAHLIDFLLNKWYAQSSNPTTAKKKEVIHCVSFIIVQQWLDIFSPLHFILHQNCKLISKIFFSSLKFSSLGTGQQSDPWKHCSFMQGCIWFLPCPYFLDIPFYILNYQSFLGHYICFL